MRVVYHRYHKLTCEVITAQLIKRAIDDIDERFRLKSAPIGEIGKICMLGSRFQSSRLRNDLTAEERLRISFRNRLSADHLITGYGCELDTRLVTAPNATLPENLLT